MASHPEFGHSTVAAEVSAAFSECVKEKTIVITGVSPGGLGYATAFALAAQAPKQLILSGRSVEKVQTSIDELKKQFPSVEYMLLEMDLASQASVRAAADKINNAVDIQTINGVINNAGVMFLPERTLTEDGIETTFATNHIGHFLFTNLIMEKLIKASRSSKTPTRIVNVTSFGHQFSPVRFSDWNLTKTPTELPADERPEVEKVAFLTGQDISGKDYSGYCSYGQSKTANVLFTVSLNQSSERNTASPHMLCIPALWTRTLTAIQTRRRSPLPSPR